ncbi:MAG TPA: DNA-3-methyladenine glycosylase 2 family protein [Acidimicrobiia bacterium]|nr:DNA-3-methyladenine glycosylase 2 family protein [Acidimicrobiia bacterium]
MPLDLRATLRPLGGRFLDDGWWTAVRTPQGPGTLRVRRTADGVEGTAWGPGADWLLGRLPLWVGLADPVEEFETEHPVVAPLARRHRGYRYGATGLVFEALIRAIVEQKVSGKEAAHSLRALWQRFGDPAPGPAPLRLPPDSERLAASPYWEYHRLGLERRRADVLRAVARDAADIEALSGTESETVQRQLRRYPGVGVWTAAETVAVSHGDPDAVSVGDYHHKNIVAWHLAGRPRGTDDQMLELLEPFRPHRGRVVRLLARAGWAPRFGPRMPIRSITDR